MFSFKNNQQKQKQLQRLLSVFVERIFFSCEDIICKFYRLGYPSSIKAFQFEIVLFPVPVYKPLDVKRLQIA